jgi:hypothetical protein
LPFADEMDMVLHPARIDRREKVTFEAELESLPDGCFVQIDQRPCLVWGDALPLWTPEGYERPEIRPRVPTVTVLTPEPIVACMRHGYRPEVHWSGDRTAGMKLNTCE